MSDIEYNAQAVIEHLTAQRHRVIVERDRLIDDVISLKAQRDELLAALILAEPFVESAVDINGYKTRKERKVLVAVRAAIAKVVQS